MTIIGTETFAALRALPQSHREFFLARQDTKLDRTKPRATGISSDRLTEFALGWNTEPPYGSWHYPSDRGDFAACELTYDMAPADLRRKMLPLLAKYRRFIENKPAPFTGPNYSAHPGQDHEDCCK